MVTWRHLLQESIPFACERDPESKYIVVGFPMDWTTSYKPGTRFAPDKIREAACNLEYYALLKNRVLDGLGFNDLGNVSLPFGDAKKSIDIIRTVVSGVAEEYPDGFYVFLGGEHLVTYPVVEVLSDKIDTLVIFDAHLDLRNDYLGVKFSHATVMRRILESSSKKLVYFGSRAFSKEELEFVSANQDLVRVYTPLDLMSKSIDSIISEIGGNVYISIDMDVFDPAIAPGVSNPEPLGIEPLGALQILDKLVSRRNIVGLDIVEVNPVFDVNDVTSLLAGKLVYEIVGMIKSR